VKKPIQYDKLVLDLRNAERALGESWQNALEANLPERARRFRCALDATSGAITSLLNLGAKS
jgi:hypothetical protein